MSWIDVTYTCTTRRGRPAHVRAIAVEQSVQMPPEAVGDDEI